MTNIYDIVGCLLILLMCVFVVIRVIVVRRRIKLQDVRIFAKSYLLELSKEVNQYVDQEQLQKANLLAEKAIVKGRGINNFDTMMRPFLEQVIDGAKRIVDSNVGKEERQELGFTITRVVKKLSDCVENVLLIARIDSKRIDYAQETIVVRDLVKGLYEEFSDSDGQQFSNKEMGGCRLSIIEGRPTLRIIADNVYLTKALREIIMNAFTFSRKGDIFMGWFYRLDSKEVEIFVEDNGVGISPEVQQQVFDVFYKGEQSQGIGLGLSVAKELVEKMGGRIYLASNPNIGTRVTVLFPSV